jgi:phosphoribosylaminoimidazole carboxylase (NCAIR synthetase)
MKEFITKLRLPQTDYASIDASTHEDVSNAADLLGYPLVIKRRDLGYAHGSGTYVLRDSSQIEQALDWINDSSVYAERYVQTVEKELSVLFCVAANNVITHYPIVESIGTSLEDSAADAQRVSSPLQQQQRNHRLVIAPAQIHSSVTNECLSAAKTILAGLRGQGIYCIEFFMCADESLLVHAVTPRPHTTGNYTVDACNISQFEMHVRAILNLPCPQPVMTAGVAMTVSVIAQTNSMDSLKAEVKEAMKIPRATIHWHG